MRGKAVISGLLAALGAAACDAGSPDMMRPEQAVRNTGPDLQGTADLVVDAQKLSTSWVIYEEDLSPNLCSVIEGDVPPGVHKTLRFTVTTPNIGDADVYIGDPNTHIDPNGDGSYSDSDGLYELDGCHGHFHFRNYAVYELLPIQPDGTLGPTVKSRKRGFCMIDTTPWKNDEHEPHASYYLSCGAPGVAGNQGISTGWADTYSKWLGGQYFVLTDPAEPVPPGEYLLRVVVNPGFAPAAGEPCPVRDSAGLCHNFAESDYGNNVGQVRITIPERVGRIGFGPGSGSPPKAEAIDDERRPVD